MDSGRDVDVVCKLSPSATGGSIPPSGRRVVPVSPRDAMDSGREVDVVREFSPSATGGSVPGTVGG